VVLHSFLTKTQKAEIDIVLKRKREFRLRKEARCPK